MINQNKLTKQQTDLLIKTLKLRFEKFENRHKNIEWKNVESKLDSNPDKLVTLFKMEESGGEPDIVFYNNKTNEFTFFDCSEESPKGRRSLCYDQNALESRKENKPKNSVLNMASEIGVTLLSESQYIELQKLGNFDTKTSSWIETPFAIRQLGGAIFGDKRYGHVFIYHNGAESYYAARGFRGSIII
jgi:hypothetical protein